MVVRLARDAAEVERALELRERVFAIEQGIDPAADRDGRDGEALHLVALAGGELQATCRLIVENGVAMLGRMVVERSARRQGIGRAVLGAADRLARDAGARRISLHAQVPVRAFYERQGYVPRGRVFVEEGIEHVAMEKLLA